jgi:hypothetical protein
MGDIMAFDTNAGVRWRPIAAVFIGVLIAGMGFGCTAITDTAKETTRAVGESTRKFTEALTPAGSNPKHQVAVMGVEDRPDARHSGFAAKFVQTFSEFFRMQCHGVLLDEAVEERVKALPRLASGHIDGYQLAMLGRPAGINFFVIGSLSDVRLEIEKTGFWLWKDTRYKLRAVLRVEIVDSTTGSKALDERFWEEMRIEAFKAEELEAAGTIPLTEIAPILDRLLKEAGQQSCAALRAQPWRGFITAVDRDRLTLSAGRANGLTEGSLLDVFDRGRILESRDRQRYLLPGDKIGEARIDSLTAHQAEAVLREKVPVGVGAAVGLK